MKKLTATVVLAIVMASPYVLAQNVKKNVSKEKHSFLDIDADEELMQKHPKFFRGFDLVKIADAALMSTINKGEFETTEQYQRRLELSEGKSIYGKVKLNSRLVVITNKIERKSNYSTPQGGAIGYEYNADNEKLEFKLNGESVSINNKTLGIAYEYEFYSSKKSKSSVGQNAFGTRVGILEIAGQSYTLATPASWGFSLEIDATPEKAKKILNSCSIVIFGKLVPPYVEKFREYSSATLSSPIKLDIDRIRLLFQPDKVYIVDRNTREIVASRDYESSCKGLFC